MALRLRRSRHYGLQGGRFGVLVLRDVGHSRASKGKKTRVNNMLEKISDE